MKYTIDECKERDATYAAPLKVRVRLHNKETDEINEHEIFMGDLPLMTKTVHLLSTGAERVIVSQLVRSPGIYYGIAHDKLGKKLYSSTVIPNRGAWLEYETDSNDVFLCARRSYKKSSDHSADPCTWYRNECRDC